MNIKGKLTIQFSLIVSLILFLFSVSIYIFSHAYRQNEYKERLRSRALTTARLLMGVAEIDSSLLRIIDQNTSTLYEEAIVVFDENNELIYRSNDSIYPSINKLIAIREYSELYYTNKHREGYGVLQSFDGDDFVVIVTAHDRYGLAKLENLKIVLFLGLLISLILVIIGGYFFANRALYPIKKIVSQVKHISISNISIRVDEGNGKDEIGELAITFNQVLTRLEEAFIMQRDFVSNASHELRTPYTVMLSEIDYSLNKDNTIEDYQNLLISLRKDIMALSKLSTGLLDLAQISFNPHGFENKQVRLDELFFDLSAEVKKIYPDYNIKLDFEKIPEDYLEITVLGNESLLKIACKNIIDNACKFSDDKSCTVSIYCEAGRAHIAFSDNGIGIYQEEIDKVFQPFYRGKNARNTRGNGIGLSLIEKIITIHNGNIHIKTEVGKGSIFTIDFQSITLSSD